MMRMKKTCVHIIIRDKFTSGYINFLKTCDLGWNHVFFTFEKDFKLDLLNNDDVHVVTDYRTVLNEYADTLDKADRIIVAAFFDDALQLLNMPQTLWDKTYIQFWGGDIYRFRQKRKGLVAILKQMTVHSMVRRCILKCAGVLTLVEKDYDAIEDIFGVKDIDHRVIQVPDDFYGLNHIDYARIVRDTDYHGKKRILVGNSATPENQHTEVFAWLKDKIDDETEVLVPLSYGLDDYRKEVIDKGSEFFGNAFVPVTDFMAREDYIGLLSTCDTAVFNNNRQQATGNIILLANLGKKLYLRDDTSMWDFFKDLHFALYRTQDLKDASLAEILKYSAAESENNYTALKKMENEAIMQWQDFFK